ncbi:hypothetical protein [Pseudomonas akapageensis]|uniref:hypothetical protein n=1 Tax=Pseudomonas akapageensis TaxID=2609961 RepID=UPI00140E2E91|nr:hypothetical protein [Pseudomonas akapageensis]
MDFSPSLPDEITIDTWHTHPASCLSHHGQACCHNARNWLISQDYSLDTVGGIDSQLLSAPRWIPERYEWGPSPWPLYWCDAIGMKKLDCGALAAIAREVYLARGVEAAPVQLIQRLSSHAIGQLRKIWRDGPGYFNWLAEDKIYHEAVAVSLDGTRIQIWDATNGWWIGPTQTEGYGAVLQVKVGPFQPDSQQTLHWGDRELTPGSWTRICT